MMTMRIWCKTMAFVTATAWGAASLASTACEAEIESNDAMQFGKASLEVPDSCKQFTVKLKHVGKLPAAAMGHNWVLTRAADVQGVAADGIAAGLANQYVKAGDARVIAFTKIIGGGETATVSFDVAKLKANESYAYFCSFPGHSNLMKGTLRLGK